MTLEQESLVARLRRIDQSIVTLHLPLLTEAADRVEKLEAENADLRRAVPLINDDGETVWPSVHDNPTVLRAMLFDAHARIEKLEAVLDVAQILIRTQDAFQEAGNPDRSRDEDVEWLRSQHLGSTFEEWSAELTDRAARRNEALDFLRKAIEAAQ